MNGFNPSGRLISFSVIFFISIICLTCAEVIPPPGGEEDRTGPTLLASFPEDGGLGIPLGNEITHNAVCNTVLYEDVACESATGNDGNNNIFSTDLKSLALAFSSSNPRSMMIEESYRGTFSEIRDISKTLIPFSTNILVWRFRNSIVVGSLQCKSSIMMQAGFPLQ